MTNLTDSLSSCMALIILYKGCTIRLNQWDKTCDVTSSTTTIVMLVTSLSGGPRHTRYIKEMI